MSYGEQNRKRRAIQLQTVMHLGMGVLYLLIGALVVYVKYFGTVELSSGIAYALGGMMIIYGLFRLWRGMVGLKERKRLD